MIYLDFAATTPVSAPVRERMTAVLTENFGNPSSPHLPGIEAAKIVEAARSEILQSIGLENSHRLIFTSGGSEGNSQVFQSLLSAEDRSGNVVVSAVEHNSVRSILPRLERAGIEVRKVHPGLDGTLAPEAVLARTDSETRLVSIMAVNNEIGFVFDIATIAGALKKQFPRVRVHTDFVHGFMKIPATLREIDFITVAAHKIYGPKGVGALALRSNRPIAALVGGSQEGGLRGGTHNVPGIAGFGEAVRILSKTVEENLGQVSRLRGIFLEEITNSLPAVQVVEGKNNSPYILGLTVPGIKSEVIVRMLSEKGIFISAGSACSSKSKLRNHTAEVLGLNPDEYLRISFSHTLTPAAVETAAQTIAATCAEFLKMMGK
ncbi:MAG: cysteine desulfurase [Acidobacteria bacterium]|nr:cysteine desulfurase [Acidobacteriota bacterium]